MYQPFEEIQSTPQPEVTPIREGNTQSYPYTEVGGREEGNRRERSSTAVERKKQLRDLSLKEINNTNNADYRCVMLASSEIFRQGHLCCVDEDDREDEIYFLASDGYPSCPDDQPSEDGALQALSQADSEIKGRAFITQNKEDRNCLQSSADLKGGSGERGVVVSTKSSCTEARDPWNIEGVGVIAETRSTCTSVQDGRYRLLAMADGKDETCINVAKDGGEVELLRSRKAEECSNNAAGRIFPSGLVKDETAELAGGHQCLAYFAVISVSGVNSVAVSRLTERPAIPFLLRYAHSTLS